MINSIHGTSHGGIRASAITLCAISWNRKECIESPSAIQYEHPIPVLNSLRVSTKALRLPLIIVPRQCLIQAMD